MTTQTSPKSQLIERKHQKVTYKFEIIKFSDDPKNEHVIEGIVNLSPVESHYLKFILLKNWDLLMVSYMVTQFDADPMETNLDCGGLLKHLKEKGHI